MSVLWCNQWVNLNQQGRYSHPCFIMVTSDHKQASRALAQANENILFFRRCSMLMSSWALAQANENILFFRRCSMLMSRENALFPFLPFLENCLQKQIWDQNCWLCYNSLWFKDVSYGEDLSESPNRWHYTAHPVLPSIHWSRPSCCLGIQVDTEQETEHIHSSVIATA